MWQAISRGLFPGSSFANFAKDQPPLQKAYAAGGFSAADGDGSVKAFTYKLKLSFRPSVPGVHQNEQTALVEQDVAVKVWYVPANLRMVKRTPEFNPGLTLTEDYDEFSFDVEIPDETFNLKR